MCVLGQGELSQHLLCVCAVLWFMCMCVEASWLSIWSVLCCVVLWWWYVCLCVCMCACMCACACCADVWHILGRAFYFHEEIDNERNPVKKSSLLQRQGVVPLLTETWSWTTCCWMQKATWKLPTLASARSAWAMGIEPAPSAARQSSWPLRCWRKRRTRERWTGGGWGSWSTKCWWERSVGCSGSCACMCLTFALRLC